MNRVTKKVYFAIFLIFIFSLLAGSCKRGEGSDKTANADSNTVSELEEKSTLVLVQTER